MTLKLRERSVCPPNRREWERQRVDEVQVVDGRKILSRHDTREQAQRALDAEVRRREDRGVSAADIVDGPTFHVAVRSLLGA